MDLIQQLYTKVTPLSEVQATNQVKSTHGGARANNTTTVANQVKHATTVAKYREVMGDDWTSSAVIKKTLNMSDRLDALKAWEAKGLVEKRKIGDEANWSRNKGYEWRFVPEKLK